MAFALSNHISSHKFLPISQTHSSSLRRPHRISATYATAEIGTGNNSQTASLYDVLGIQTGATCQEIKFAYRRLARVLHPDAADGDGSSAEKFMRLHAAYATLSDPEKRATYDRSLFRRRGTAILTVNGLSEVNMQPRTWETDQCW